MVSKNLLKGSSKSGESEVIKYIPDEQKIDVEIRTIIRIKPTDLGALKNSLEDWSIQWD